MARRHLVNLAVAMLSLFLSTKIVVGGETIDALLKAGMPGECAPFGAIVSASEGNFSSVNQFGCVGAFQFCPATFAHYYGGGVDQFIAHPDQQVAAWLHYDRDQWNTASKNHLDLLLGQSVCHGTLANTRHCAVVHHSAILMACQFGCGRTGKLAAYLNNHDCNARNVKDGNLVSVCDYLLRGAGYDVSCFAGGVSP